jgi:Mn2+/Fe2+ NRAMP family transporter
MKSNFKTVGLGAAFLMALSAVGPGFLTQTAVFTEKHLMSFGFVILMVIIIDIIGQLNIWRIMGISGMRGQDIANNVIPGSGYLLAFLIALGGLAFNIGNVGGASLGLKVLFGFNDTLAIILAGLIGAALFLAKDMLKAMDNFVKVLGALIILVMAYMVAKTTPPLGDTFIKSIYPDNISALGLPILTLVGGTIGGYIVFSGGHRIIDSGMTGKENISNIDKSAVSGIVVVTLIRVLLFLAVLGVVIKGAVLDPKDPASSAFNIGAGVIGYKIFGLVMWAAGATSIVGAAYTSVSFLKTLFSPVKSYEKHFIIGFILFSTLIMAFIGRPVTLLILAGSLNGLILPLSFFLILLGTFKKAIVGDYQHPKILTFLGFLVVIVMGYMGFTSLSSLSVLFR